MIRKKLIREAEEWEKEADNIAKHSSKYKRSQRVNMEISKKYKIAGDRWIGIGEPRKAMRDYKLAIENAYNEGYKNKIQEKIDQLILSEPKKPGKLERHLGFAIFAIASFLVALFFISFNLTGNAIGGVSQNNSNWISAVLFVCGLIFSFFYLKTKNQFPK